MDKKLVHIGVKRRSGRYPWGSGGEKTALVNKLESEGFSEREIAKSLKISTTELRNQKALAKAEEKEAIRLNVVRQREGGMSVAAISREFNLPPSTVRDLLKPHANLKYRIIKNISNKLKSLIGKSEFVDVGKGTEVYLEVSKTKLDNAITLLKNEGYEVHYLDVEQLGTAGGKKTTIKVIGPPGSTFGDLVAKRNDIIIPNFFSKDSGITFFQPDDINNMSSDRILIKYKNEGGQEKDGLIEMRRGVPELNLGEKRYAQVRIGVDGTHFMKGMAVLKDDVPDGFDVVYYTSKENTGNKLDVLKPQVKEGASKFGAVVKPNLYSKDGKEEFGVVNIVRDEGAWEDWDRNLSSQVLAKQSPRLAKKQLDIVYKNNRAELDEILSLTNPVVKEHLLKEFADKMDKASVELQAAALPRQTTNVILPDPKIKPTEAFAPNYNDGEQIIMIRYPHGGVFEIPTLTVNNKYSDYKDIIGKTAKDAVAIHPSVAQKLSGADFDGDFVLVIPDKNKKFRTESTLAGLKNFDPKTEYPKYPGMTVMSEGQKQQKMGDVSNLITDMTIKGASHAEIAAAVRHSMVVIDAVNHELNYKQSYIDNGIASLKKKYQGGANRGASTLISKSKSEERVPQRYDHYDIDPVTGEKKYTFTNRTYISKKTGKEVPYTTKSTKGAEFPLEKLTSGTLIEGVYGKHRDNLINLANEARLASTKVTPTPYSRQAYKTYFEEVKSLDRKYKNSIKAKPIERKAQVLAKELYRRKVAENPEMSYKEKTKQKGKAIRLARSRLKSNKPSIDITPREWEAIEMGALSKTKLKNILRNADMDVVRNYATPRAIKAGLSPSKKTRALQLIKAGYSSAEIAGALGVPVTQIHNIDKE